MGTWSQLMATASSNKRELVACHKALMTFSPILKKENCTDILILTDNTTAMYNINHRAAAKTLSVSLKKFLIYADSSSFNLHASHIPGKINSVSDSLSRLAVSGDYSISKQIFQQICKQLKFHPSFDLFANESNHLTKFWCATRQSRKRGYINNAFHISWGNIPAFLHLPVPLILRTLRKSTRSYFTCNYTCP
jgi:hypothetical protein